MQSIYLEATRENPKVILDQKKNIFEISGRSLVLDTFKFYNPLISWIREYTKQANQTTEFVFDLEYLNSASVRKIIDILLVLENLHQQGKQIKVFWLYNENDEITKERGEEIRSLLNFPFELKIVD